MKKCYVDGHFKVTKDLYSARGLVHQVNGKMEILILKPVAHNKNLADSWSAMMDWGRCMYAGKSYNFPSADACLLANYLEPTPLIVSCYTSTKMKKNKGFDLYKSIDDEGQLVLCGGQMKNVYIAVTLSHDEFYAINPWFDLRPYQTKFSY